MESHLNPISGAKIIPAIVCGIVNADFPNSVLSKKGNDPTCHFTCCENPSKTIRKRNNMIQNDLFIVR
jgi:hypothetical protein